MKKYLLKRILFSLFSFIVVLGIVIILIYNLMNRNSILQNDEIYKKLRYNEQEAYKYKLFQDYGYLTYENYTNSTDFNSLTAEEQSLAKKALKNSDSLDVLKENANIAAYVAKMQTSGYTVNFMPTLTSRKGQKLSDPYLIASKESNPLVRVWSFFSNLIKVETVWDVDDPNLKDRYVRFEWDERSNMPALVGSGTFHKYLLYFDDKFPFVHQNMIHLRLGTSFTIQTGSDVVDYMKSATGIQIFSDQVLPKDLGKENPRTDYNSIDFHTVTYNKNHGSADDIYYFGADEPYTNYGLRVSGLSRIGNSFVIGLIATLIAYIVGLPLGIWMAQRKDKLVDKIGNLYIIFIMAVPSLAYIFMLAAIGTSVFKLPYKFAFDPNSILPYILPIVSLALPSIGGLMKWMRRYMIDQQNSDYVKFARSQGLSEREIFSKHIARNAFIFLVHSIPADILGALVGAIVTERVYGVPGVGNMLTESINKLDNAVIVGVTAFYTALTIIALILGDLLLIKYDPRISLTNEKS